MDLENPYQSPLSETEVVGRRSNGSVAWILFSFEGRIPRRVYWGVWLGTSVVFYALLFLLVGLSHSLREGVPDFLPIIVIVILYVPLLWILLAVQVKRWHDRGKSGWYVLINLIPYIGPLWVLVELGCLRGTLGPNEYGVDPT